MNPVDGSLNTNSHNFQFPHEIYQKFDGVDFRLIDELTFLSNLQAQKSPTGAQYCIPGREYLAKKLGVCIRTVSRHIGKLKGMGVIEAIQRRPVRGQFKSNLYKVFDWTVWKVRKSISLIRDVAKALKSKTRAPAVTPTPMPHRRTYVARIAPEKEIAPSSDAIFLHKNPILKLWMARGAEAL